MAVVLRRVVPGDWPAVRALRLEALLDTPLGFLETHEQARAKDEGDWRYRAVRGSVGGDSCQLLALRDDRPVGTAFTFADGDDPSTWWLGGVYLAPDARGGGLLDRLVEALRAHARGEGAVRLRLQVHEDNLRARAAYARLGFVPTGAREPYPLAPGDELTMELAVLPEARPGGPPHVPPRRPDPA